MSRKFKKFVLPATIYDAVMTLQAHCAKQTDCSACPLDAEEEGAEGFRCMLTRWDLPEDWADNLITRKNLTHRKR